MKKYITTNTRKTSIVYIKVGGNDVRLVFLTVIINIHENNGPE